MEIESTAKKLPGVIRLPYAGRCRCGEQVAAGERIGYIWPEARVVCLHCMARLQAERPVDPAQARHTRLVAERANGLMSRLIAVKTLGTLCAELQPMVAWTVDSSESTLS